MTLRLYDTATRSVRDFVPREAGKVGVYLCGLTLQAPPHIGHLRSGVNYDVLRRWLLAHGLEVRFIRNLTDIDDKILVKAVEGDLPYWSIAYANELKLTAAYRALNVLSPTYEPRATGHIPEMQQLIAKLIDTGHAYPAADGSGDVYFDVLSWPAYGTLSNQSPTDMQPAGDAPDRCKRDPRDFALWKGVKPGEPADAYWPSPWGRGRPGWHIECSAMCWRYLGAEFDIHGGGLDLTFPHHENELAQSQAAGLPFARYWVHHGLLNIGGAKMGKSCGNSLDLAYVDSLGVRPVELRYYYAAAHYRSVIDYSEDALREAAVAYRRIEGFVQRATEQIGAGQLGAVPTAFAAAMDDDLNTSAALAVLHEAVRDGNTALTGGDDVTVRTALGQVRAMLDILGVDPLDPAWTDGGGADDLRAVVDSLVALALEQRAQARSRRDWSAADAVRDQLKQAGVVVEDTPHGPRWTIGEQN
ncbi:cysteine--tRNA ligase [Salinispora arenicola]|uniref:Cysteine--tRNA ligase n=1 Tax=Salinispora arenicola TaxID=168697 RepID=A0A542XLX9_SALAC|nr:cysteine--tRNA ligase [Salinispora arenicola]MCN0152808.1 cysteine--tRNA ligase [Salinispora arenicola]NIL43784.1 cysteine--tRNA ligase [Salinispora arenicola]TQL36653.1 cysteinyl-tRNA synthetase [Salinispora arenicola]GIM87593.1 cysteine--tRNA ligase [Salinispora arenicola]